MVGNQREMLTEHLLEMALIKLLEREDFRDITISELCEEAGINRSTFYRHYDNQFVLLDKVLDEYVEALQPDELSPYICNPLKDDDPHGRQIMIECFTFIEQHLDEYRVLVTKVSPNVFERHLALRRDTLIAMLLDRVGRRTAEYIVDYILSGGAQCMSTWVISENRCSIEKIADLILEMNRGAVAAGVMATQK